MNIIGVMQLDVEKKFVSERFASLKHTEKKIN